MAKRSNNDKRHRTQRPKGQTMIKDIYRTQWLKDQIMIKDIEHNGQKIK
jgi:hypothetical protein